MAFEDRADDEQGINQKQLAVLYRRLLDLTQKIARRARVVSDAQLSLLVNIQLAKENVLPKVILERFDTEGTSAGTPWAPLRPATLAQRRFQGFPPGPILLRTGVLKDAAVRGKVTVTSEDISMTMVDATAPDYGTGEKSESKRLSDYAGALNAKRPFYGPLSKEEREPILTRRDEIADRELRKINQG